MAIEAVVSVVLQKLSNLLKEESLSQNKVITYELGEITNSLNSMRNLMISSSINMSNQQAEEYLLAVYDMEDEIEKFTLEIVRQRKALGFLTNHAFFFNNLNSCQKLHQKIKKIITNLEKRRGHESNPSAVTNKVPVEDKKYEETAVVDHKTTTNALVTLSSAVTSETQTASRDRYTKELNFTYSCNEEEMQIVGTKEECFQKPKHVSCFSYREEELGIFGFREEINTLVVWLARNNEHVVSIIGQGGIGKTTLARAIYRNRDVKDHFECCAWVSVLEEHTTKDILRILVKATENLKDDTDKTADEKEMKFKLSEYLKTKRYLVVLDDISNCNIWEDIKDAFPVVKNGSKLVVTSRQSMAARLVSSESHYLTPLSEEDSWNMFRKKVGEGKNWALIPANLKQELLQICRGLPLNIVLLAGMFSVKHVSSWSQIISFGQNSIDILSLCFNDLTDHLKVCLLYSVLFPKEFDIPVRRLLRLWLAEGFVKQQSTELFPEDTAQQYFEELLNRNMIQISKVRSDNSPRWCRVLGAVHDYLMPAVREINLFHIYRNSFDNEEVVGSLSIRRIVEYGSTIGLPQKHEPENDRRKATETENSVYPSFLSLSFTSGGHKTKSKYGIANFTLSSPKKTQHKSSFSNASHLRSYLSLSFQTRDHRQAKRIGSFLGNIVNHGFGLLRVLDLEGVYKPRLPEKLGNFCHLRYLGLRSTFLDSLPQSVGELTHLQTLDVKHTYIDELPESIWRLKKLHHLNLNEMRLNMRLHSSLTLLTLWGLLLDEKVHMKNGLDELHDLRELGITFNLSSNQDDLMDWVANLRALQSLRLRSKDIMGRPSKLILKSMSNLGQLSHLNLLGNLEKLPDQNEFPPTLRVLTLSISLLKQDPMKTLEELPCLTVLRLLGQAYLGKEMVCHQGGFSKLRVLKIWMLKELESWFVEEGAMQSLKHLDIRCCHKLDSIPTTLLQQQNLEELVLTDMPPIFTAEVKRLKSDYTSLTLNHWKYAPPSWEQDDSTIVMHS